MAGAQLGIAGLGQPRSRVPPRPAAYGPLDGEFGRLAAPFVSILLRYQVDAVLEALDSFAQRSRRGRGGSG